MSARDVARQSSMRHTRGWALLLTARTIQSNARYAATPKNTMVGTSCRWKDRMLHQPDSRAYSVLSGALAAPSDAPRFRAFRRGAGLVVEEVYQERAGFQPPDCVFTRRTAQRGRSDRRWIPSDRACLLSRSLSNSMPPPRVAAGCHSDNFPSRTPDKATCLLPSV